jgi:hypothetical protein
MADYDENRGRSDRADEWSSGRSSGRLTALGELDDFEVVDGYADPRGWEVFTADGRKVGRVHDLIVDAGAMRTRYLDVTLDRASLRIADEREVLVPVGAARLQDDGARVVLTGVSAIQLTGLPAYRHGAITRDYERSLLAGFGAPSSAAQDDFYGTRHFDDSHFYVTREHAGDAAGAPGGASDAGRVAGPYLRRRSDAAVRSTPVDERRTAGGGSAGQGPGGSGSTSRRVDDERRL